MWRSGIKQVRRSLENGFLRAARCAAARRVSPGLTPPAWPRGGFDPLKQRWWNQWKLEPLLNKLRYIWLIERALALNRSSPAGNGNRTDQRMIFLQFGHLGDMLHTVPVLRALKTARPDVAITLVTGPWNKEIAQRIPYTNDVRFIVPRWESYARGHRPRAALEDEWAFYAELRAKNPGVVFDATSGSLPTLFAMLALRPALGIGPDLFTEEAWGLPDWYRTITYNSRLYEARRLLNLLRPLGIDSNNEKLEFEISDKDRKDAFQLLSAIGVANDGNWAILAPGAGWPGKIWPEERFAEIGARISKTWKWRVFVVGTSSERALAERIVSAIGAPAVSLAGQTSVGVLAALIQRSRLLISNDSGPYHLAAALDAPTVLLYGPGFPSKWVTVRASQRVLRHEVGCRCYPWHPRARCEYDRACTKAISVEEVWRAVCDLMSHHGSACA